MIAKHIIMTPVEKLLELIPKGEHVRSVFSGQELECSRIIEVVPRMTTADTGTLPVVTCSSFEPHGASHLPAIPRVIL